MEYDFWPAVGIAIVVMVGTAVIPVINMFAPFIGGAVTAYVSRANMYRRYKATAPGLDPGVSSRGRKGWSDRRSHSSACICPACSFGWFWSRGVSFSLHIPCGSFWHSGYLWRILRRPIQRE